MYSRIMVPVDLAHADKLSRALETAAVLAKADGATLIYTGVASTTPDAIAQNPKEFADKLAAFADAQRKVHGMPAEAHAVTSHDPAVDMGDKLIEAVEETRADVVVMATHIPGVADHWFQGKAAHVAEYAPVSVLVIR